MGVSIPDTDIMLPATVHDMGLEGTYRHQVMTLELDERVMNEAKNINQLEVDFANGKRMLADVGEINLFPYSEPPLSGISSGAASDNTGYHLYEANEDVEITCVYIPFQNQLHNGLTLAISDDQEKLSRFEGSSGPDEVPKGEAIHDGLFPISKKKGELVSIRYNFSFGQDDPNRLHFYEIHAKLLGKTRDGTDFSQTFSISCRPELDDRTLKAIIKGEAK
jgi:hypothetical protein